jgi:hypothetical protein
VKGPGLAKARALPHLVERMALLCRAPDPAWRDLFARADTVSEGAARSEKQGRVWYGSTSLILRIEGADADRLAKLAAVAERDLHIRLRAVRAAQREACLRAPSRLGRISCEIRVTADPAGVRIDVDLQAPLIEGRSAGRAAP